VDSKANQKKPQGNKNLFGLDSKKIRNYLILGLVVLVGYLINKKVFLMAIFIVVTTVGKILRQQIGNSMLMFDPLVFFSILIMKYWGFSYLLLFLFVTVFFADAIAGHLTPGSFINYGLFHVCPIIAYVIFGKLSLLVYGMITCVFYSVSYVFFRTVVLPDDPIAVYSKAITNVVFVFLYLSFFGPLFALIM
jgi:hypothetical protein